MLNNIYKLLRLGKECLQNQQLLHCADDAQRSMQETLPGELQLCLGGSQSPGFICSRFLGRITQNLNTSQSFLLVRHRSHSRPLLWSYQCVDYLKILAKSLLRH